MSEDRITVPVLASKKARNEMDQLKFDHRVGTVSEAVNIHLEHMADRRKEME